jgi:hypothetical protein
MILMVANDSFGYFYYACGMKKRSNPTNAQQYIILLADYHDKKHPANKDQRAYFETLLQRYSNQKVKLIVEDLGSINNDGRMICFNYGINCAKGVLGNLANKARSLGIDVDNVEYRYYRVASIGPLINNITANPYAFKSSATITLMSLYKEIINEIQKIKKYDDGKKLNKFYKRVVANMYTALSKMKLYGADNTRTVAHHCAILKQGNYRQELEKFCIFDSPLIDSNIMHSIACCGDATLIFVVAGGSHIECVHKLLKKMGYDEFFVCPDDHFKPIDIVVLDTLL